MSGYRPLPWRSARLLSLPAALAALLWLGACGCDRPRGSERRTSVSTAPARPATAATPATSSGPRRVPPTARTASPTADAASSASSSASATAPTGSVSADDAGVLVPIAATPQGNEIFLGAARAVTIGPMGALALASGEELVVASLTGDAPAPLPDPTERLPFYPVALAGDAPAHAYWVVKGRLVRRSVAKDGSVGQLEVLAKDAASGSIVAAARAAGPPARDVAVYIRGDESDQGERGAGLWVEGQGAKRLSQVSGGATGLALTPVGPRRLQLVVLDGRNAMSSVHAVELSLSQEGAARVGEDRVVYVAGGVEWHTSPQVIPCASSPVALLPVAKDISHFGLVSLLIPANAGQASESWVDYANGLDPAPVAVATICGEPMVALVRPEKAGTGATQLVQLGQLDAAGKIIGLRTVAAAGLVSHLALGAARPRPPVPRAGAAAGWVAYATDAGLWAKALGCVGAR